MEYRTLGNSGLKVSRLVLGSMNIGDRKQFAQIGGLGLDEARRLFDVALDAGVNMIDTANMYSYGQSEELIGQALRGKRDDVLIASKVRMRLADGPNDGGASAYHIIREVEKSLRRLDTDHLDLLYLHQWDGQTPIEESLTAVERLVAAGKVRYLGISNFNGWQIMKTRYTARLHHLSAPVVQQVYYTPEARESEYEIIPAALDQGLGTLVWGPLGEGLLSGKVRRGQDVASTTRQGTDWPEPHVVDRERAYDIIDLLAEIADARQVSIPRLILAWELARPGITGLVISGRTEQQLLDNLSAPDLLLTDEETARINEATQLPAYYPYWHRIINATDRPDPAEAPFLDGYRQRMRG
ncbi:aldo/keto reductase [Streptomyces sp. NPDC051217]|uniref:aldo/keto reductase n=1 Tax=Streptomyces sp. NPDC051217 TaxID=3365644 RepID=UPI0037AACB99